MRIAATLLAILFATPANASLIHYRTVAVENVPIFYRDAGAPGRPVLILLHGRQTSSHMFRALIPLLAAHYRVIAPDLPGFGQSGTPDASFSYTFDHLGAVVTEFIAAIGVSRYGLVMQDFGVPIGFRVATAAPARITLIVAQNGVICERPNREPPWLAPFWANRDPATETRLRNSFRLRTTIRYYQLGASHSDAISPDSWALSQYYLDQPGRQDQQVELVHDMPSNDAHFAAWQAYLRAYRPPTLILWGRDSPIYSLAHIDCYRNANPRTIVRLYAGGHFMLEEHAAEAAGEILRMRPIRSFRTRLGFTARGRGSARSRN
jgi:pimeloyl-ACP methyl ester carboxylesterase